MKLKITFILLFTYSFVFSQFPGEITKEEQIGPDSIKYKVKDVVQLGNALNGKTFRNIFAYKHKDIFDKVDDALDLNLSPSYSVFEDKEHNLLIKGEFIMTVPNDFNGFKGRIKYFKKVKSENNLYTFAIIKIPNTKNRIAIPLESAILTGEMLSHNENFKPKELVENLKLDEINIKSFSNDFDLKLLSCKGDKNTQQVWIEFLIKHKNVHQKVCFNKGKKDAKAYDLEGNEYNSNTVSIGSEINKGYGAFICNKIPTNVPVKASINLIKILPTVEKLSFVTVKIGFKDFDDSYKYTYGNIEIQNLDIDWEN